MSVKNRRLALILFILDTRDGVGDHPQSPADLPAGIFLLPVEWKVAWVKKTVQIFLRIEKKNLLSLW